MNTEPTMEENPSKMHRPESVQKRHLRTLLETGNLYPAGVEMITRGNKESDDASLYLEDIIEDITQKHEEASRKMSSSEEDIQEEVEELLQKVNGHISDFGIHEALGKRDKKEKQTPLVLTPELLKKLEVMAYTKQLTQILERPEGSYSGKDTESTEQILLDLGVSREEIDAIITSHINTQT